MFSRLQYGTSQGEAASSSPSTTGPTACSARVAIQRGAGGGAPVRLLRPTVYMEKWNSVYSHRRKSIFHFFLTSALWVPGGRYPLVPGRVAVPAGVPGAAAPPAWPASAVRQPLGPRETSAPRGTGMVLPSRHPSWLRLWRWSSSYP